jgi:hypothetical protein
VAVAEVFHVPAVAVVQEVTERVKTLLKLHLLLRLKTQVQV